MRYVMEQPLLGSHQRLYSLSHDVEVAAEISKLITPPLFCSACAGGKVAGRELPGRGPQLDDGRADVSGKAVTKDARCQEHGYGLGPPHPWPKWQTNARRTRVLAHHYESGPQRPVDLVGQVVCPGGLGELLVLLAHHGLSHLRHLRGPFSSSDPIRVFVEQVGASPGSSLQHGEVA